MRKFRSAWPLPVLVLLLSVAVVRAAPTDAADALLAARKWQEAADAYRTVTESDPRDGAAWAGLGQALLGTADAPAAVPALERALELGQRPTSTLLSLARAHAAAGDGDAAIRRLHELAALGSTARLAAANAPEFATLAGSPVFEAALDALAPCRAAEFRQFDFWIGDWDVTNRAVPGRPPAHNRISRVQGGCVILEEYDTPSGYGGVSLSYHDPRDGRWYQTWVDNQGQPIVHSGSLVGGAMVLLDKPAEGAPLNRTTWTPLPTGRVRQHWESSTDGGDTWTTVFDGLYVRRSSDRGALEARPRTDNTELARHLRRIVGEVEGEPGRWAFRYAGVQMMLVTDEEWDRMRLIAPIAEVEQVDAAVLRRMLEANFDRALDAKYALWQGGVWSTFVHPLGELSKNHLINAMRQVAALHDNFGSSFSGTEILFGGGE